MRFENKSTLVEDIKRAIAIDGPVLVDVRVTREENTYPMIPAGCAAGGGGSGLAVQSSCSARTLHAQGSDPDGGQLERAVAWTGGHAEPERVHDQGRDRV